MCALKESISPPTRNGIVPHCMWIHWLKMTSDLNSPDMEIFQFYGFSVYKETSSALGCIQCYDHIQYNIVTLHLQDKKIQMTFYSLTP